MTAVNSHHKSSIQYTSRTVKRAARAMRCAPFKLNFYAAMFQQSVELKAVSGETGLQNSYTKRSLTEFSAENELLWLIQVGVLRREVDGQGITDSFRLTPLGRQLTEKVQLSPRQRLTPPSLSDRIYNALSRWLRLPF
jgi:hypothetical protein